MHKYEKIETLYARDTNGTKKLIEGCFRDETIKCTAKLNWIWTEKVDGTNIRIYWDGYSISFHGRTEKSSIPATLVHKLESIFLNKEVEELFEQTWSDKEVILFGEGYGERIQNGSHYIADGVDFILFDVLVGENYQPRERVESIAKMFNIKVVPIVGYGDLFAAYEFVRQKPLSIVADGRCIMEGVVCRPEVELRDRGGDRLIVKIKVEDMT